MERQSSGLYLFLSTQAKTDHPEPCRQCKSRRKLSFLVYLSVYVRKAAHSDSIMGEFMGERDQDFFRAVMQRCDCGNAGTFCSILRPMAYLAPPLIPLGLNDFGSVKNWDKHILDPDPDDVDIRLVDSPETSCETLCLPTNKFMFDANISVSVNVRWRTLC